MACILDGNSAFDIVKLDNNQPRIHGYTSGKISNGRSFLLDVLLNLIWCLSRITNLSFAIFTGLFSINQKT